MIRALFPFLTFIYIIIAGTIVYFIYMITEDEKNKPATPQKKPVNKFYGKSKSERIGIMGEDLVKKELETLDPEKYLILSDVLIKNEERYSQIDHIVVSDYGIFIIETKAISGYIIGNEKDKKWQIKHRWGTSYIQNPIFQNYGHVKALQKLLSINEYLFIPIVCIIGDYQDQSGNINNVIHLYELNTTILKYQNKIVNSKESIYEYIKNNNITDESIRKNHIDSILSTKKNNDSVICPKCGGELTFRISKNGYDFIGCTNYPKCRYTRKLYERIITNKK